MLALLEHMYNELGVVSEFNINPLTLKRWLVSSFEKLFCSTRLKLTK